MSFSAAVNFDSVTSTDTDRLTDEDLAVRFRESGCEVSVDELLRRHLRRVRAMIFPMILDATLADDLTQETFLRAWKGLSSFRAEAKFSTWLTRIAWNVVHDEIARRNREPQLSANIENVVATGRPEAAVLGQEFDEQVKAALEELSPKLRAAIVLTGIQQLSPDEAAQLEGCSVATIYWRIHEARKLLGQRLMSYLNS